MKTPPYSYLSFRRQVARKALGQFIASLVNSLEVVLLAFGPVMLGLVACIALPGLLAATLPWYQAVGLLLVQALLVTAPVWLLRQRLHPLDVARWSRALPISARQQWLAEAAVAGLIAGPLALAHAVSCALWFYQWPDWLQPVAPQALACAALSLLLGWALATVLLMRRARPGPPRAAAGSPATTTHYDAPQRVRLAGLHFWRQLFWLPCWRGDSAVGIRQTWLFFGALLSMVLWLSRPALVAWMPPAVWGAGTSMLLMLLTDRGDKAVTEQIALLRPAVASWPLALERLFTGAIAATLLPGAVLMACFAALALGHATGVGAGAGAGAGAADALRAAGTGAAGAAGLSHTVALVWLACAGVAQLAIVGLRTLTARGRVVLVMGAVLILTAIGSELWN
ncbi:hypothetical protein ASF61_17665 [Duganella sp. Leaf126]|uniref:hypothetical protein n=1 Tax=Duganella sp. Leaf126 TaxID=1736266 RepID=UPI0006F9B550|nr:hypothetical protein [Duganella sp. Leaf126]KQQ31054.1 hypothetical protein ASF61_17665 [Duganella sp. Leaf126]